MSQKQDKDKNNLRWFCIRWHKNKKTRQL